MANSFWIAKDNLEYQGVPMSLWECTICDHVHGIDRHTCNNCHDGTRPRMNPAMRRELTSVWDDWDNKKGRFAFLAKTKTK